MILCLEGGIEVYFFTKLVKGIFLVGLSFKSFAEAR